MKRIRITLTSLVLVALALVIGAMPASARSAAGGRAGTAALTVEPAQLGPPTGLTATVANPTEVDLSWTAPSDGSPDGYYVYESTSQGGEPNTDPVNTDLTTDTSYPVTGLTTGTTYYFEVTAVAGSNESDPSNETSATPGQPAQLGPPTGLTATVANPTEVDLSWTAPSDGSPDGYNIYEGNQSGGEDTTSPVNDSPVTTTSYKATNLDSGTQYYFVVKAVDAAGNESDPSNEASASTGNGVPLGPPGTSVSPGLFIVPIIIAAGIVGALVERRRRRRRRAASVPQQPVPGPTVRAEPHAGQPAEVSVHTTGTGATHSVRIVPYPGASITTIKEPPS